MKPESTFFKYSMSLAICKNGAVFGGVLSGKLNPLSESPHYTSANEIMAPQRDCKQFPLIVSKWFPCKKERMEYCGEEQTPQNGLKENRNIIIRCCLIFGITQVLFPNSTIPI